MPHITFVHGTSNSPAPEVLHYLWRCALTRHGRLDRDAEGTTSSMVYWADLLGSVDAG
jgi:hypothetical protein